jgi:hypothetical protein
MNTVAQLVIAAILNFLGMAPEAKEEATPIKAEIFAGNEFNTPRFTEEDKICYYYNFKGGLAVGSYLSACENTIAQSQQRIIKRNYFSCRRLNSDDNC